jgi:hypothetical protein
LSISDPDLSDDDALLAALSVSIDHLDPVPAAAVGAASGSWELGHFEGEVAARAADAAWDDSLALRRDEADLKSLTFVASRLTLEIEIDDQRHAVGLITPAAATVIEVDAASPQAPHATRTVRTDELGRFQMDLGIGLCRLRVGSGPDAVVTSWFYC